MITIRRGRTWEPWSHESLMRAHQPIMALIKIFIVVKNFFNGISSIHFHFQKLGWYVFITSKILSCCLRLWDRKKQYENSLFFPFLLSHQSAPYCGVVLIGGRRLGVYIYIYIYIYLDKSNQLNSCIYSLQAVSYRFWTSAIIRSKIYVYIYIWPWTQFYWFRCTYDIGLIKMYIVVKTILTESQVSTFTFKSSGGMFS